MRKGKTVWKRRGKGELSSVEEILRHADPRMVFLVEVKKGVGDYKRAMEEFIEIFKRYGRQNRLIIQTFNLHMLEYIKQEHPDIIIALITKHLPKGRLLLTPMDNYLELIKNRIYNKKKIFFQTYGAVSQIVDIILLPRPLMPLKTLRRLMLDAEWENAPILPTHINKSELMEEVYFGKTTVGMTIDPGQENELYQFLGNITK